DRRPSERLARDPDNPDARLDVGLDESMDASHRRQLRHCERSEAIQKAPASPWIASLRSQ
ncbi:MAG: hypothetical protein DI623_10115, partial [Sphingomonas sanxanigenens]